MCPRPLDTTMSHKEPKVDKSGWLYKQGEARKSWKKRFMKLCGDKLYYYSSPKVCLRCYSFFFFFQPPPPPPPPSSVTTQTRSRHDVGDLTLCSCGLRYLGCLIASLRLRAIHRHRTRFVLYFVMRALTFTSHVSPFCSNEKLSRGTFFILVPHRILHLKGCSPLQAMMSGRLTFPSSRRSLPLKYATTSPAHTTCMLRRKRNKNRGSRFCYVQQ